MLLPYVRLVSNMVSLERREKVDGLLVQALSLHIDFTALECIIPQRVAVNPFQLCTARMSLCSGMEGTAETFSCFLPLTFQELS